MLEEDMSTGAMSVLEVVLLLIAAVIAVYLFHYLFIAFLLAARVELL